jgi:hypothetical protein
MNVESALDQALADSFLPAIPRQYRSPERPPMMHEFLANNRAELERRCREKVAQRPGRSASSQQLENGVPIFLDQLIRTLRIEQGSNPSSSHTISGPAGGTSTLSEVGASATQHGKDLLEMGFAVDEVVHDYGDLCQAITDLAVERDAPFQINEFRTLNRCLDNAIADAVSSSATRKSWWPPTSSPVRARSASAYWRMS